MNRLLYVLLISAITILGFTMHQQNDVGHISFQFATVAFETNLIVFTAAVLCATFIVLLGIKLLVSTKSLFIRLRDERGLRQSEKARLALKQGLIEYAEGHFERSEKTLMSSIKHSDNRFPVLMNAARAAQQLGAHDRRDDYLSKAYDEEPEANFAVCLTKAELQLAHGQNEQALATLSQLHENNPDHSYVITLLVNTYRHLHDWVNLQKILPTLKKQDTMTEKSLLAFEVEVYTGQMDEIAKQQDKAALTTFWDDVPAHLSKLNSIVEHYARKLVHIGAVDEAENVLRVFLDSHWHDSTIILYSELDVAVDNKQLEMVEGWLKEHQNDAHLLLALGKMCISRSLWGKARSYLEASIAINPMPENYLKLARLLEEHMADNDAAQTAYRQGLHLMAGEDADCRAVDKEEANESQAPRLKIVKS